MLWRWDQGRLDYFQLDEIKKSSQSLMNYENKGLPRNQEEDYLRIALAENSDRPFAPLSYKVWRNYKRVFGCQLLATEINGVLKCTDLCRALASGQIDNDQYIVHVVTNFYYPSPVFDNYSVYEKQEYIACAVIKLLIAEYVKNNNQALDIDIIIGTLKEVKFVGDESIEFYRDLRRIKMENLNDLGDELRQFRELIIFISQLTYLKWLNGKLVLDVSTKEQALILFSKLNPRKLTRKANPSEEILQLGSHISEIDFVGMATNGGIIVDDEFAEGNKIRATHMRVERSSKLKEFFFAQANINHHICDMCNIDTKSKYSWIERLVELHHLLPLSSSIKVEKKSTSLSDIIPLCPTCHRATHKYYSLWLKDRNQKDFNSREEAHAVYNEAKKLLQESKSK